MSTSHSRFVHRLRRGALAIAALAACAIPAAARATPTRAIPTLVVFTDATRLPGFQLYAKTHPGVHLQIKTVDMGSFPTKVLLFNRTGAGWPDVVFTGGPNQVAALSTPQYGYTADLTPLVPASTIANFAPGSLSQCRFNGKLYCLRNDIAQEVLWYNAKLMKQFGYTVPATWEQYQALGLRVAKEHPGYLMGGVGDFSALYTYYWASGCPITELTGAASVRINLSDGTCTRVTTLLDSLLAARSIARVGPFDPTFIAAATQDKLLMIEEASWFGEYVFKPTYKTPKGEIAVAPPLRWAAETTAWTSGHGGGAYFVSAHSTYPQAAADVAVWMSTNNAYQATAPTYPAYTPAANAWSVAVGRDPFYASNPVPALKQAASLIRPTWGFVRYDAESTFNTTVAAPVTRGQSVASTISAFQTHLEQLARIAGYSVTH